MTYIANPVSFDGSTDYLMRTGILTGAVAGKIILISTWFRNRVAGALGQENRILTIRSGTASRLILSLLATSNLIQLSGRTSGGTTMLQVRGPAITDTIWHHLAISANVGNASERSFFLDGADLTATASWDIYTTTTNIDLAPATTPFVNIASYDAGGTLMWDGDLADLYFTTPGSYFDLATPANLAKFISATGAPVDPGSGGSLPTGTAALVLLSGPTDTWHTNDGTGSGFTENGALTDGGVPLPTEPPIYAQTKFRLYSNTGVGLGSH